MRVVYSDRLSIALVFIGRTATAGAFVQRRQLMAENEMKEMVRNVGVMSLDQIFVENRKNYAKQRMDTASPFTGRSHFFIPCSGFCLVCLEMCGAHFFESSFKSREREGTEKNFDFTRFGTRSHTPTKLTPFIYRRALNVNRDDDNEEEEDMEERTHKSTPM